MKFSINHGVCILFIALSISFSIYTFADDGFLGGSGNNPIPAGENKIQLKSEIVKILFENSKTYFDCTFIFFNQGEKTKILTGFPAPDSINESEPGLEDLEQNSNLSINDFEAFVNNKKVNAKLTAITPQSDAPSMRKYKQWYAWEMEFEPHEIKTVRNRYWVHTTGGASGIKSVHYILETGSSWYDKIENAEVLVKFPWEYAVQPLEEKIWNYDSTKAREYVILGDTIKWKFHNFKPQENVSIEVRATGEFSEFAGILKNILSEYLHYNKQYPQKDQKDKILNWAKAVPNEEYWGYFPETIGSTGEYGVWATTAAPTMCKCRLYKHFKKSHSDTILIMNNKGEADFNGDISGYLSYLSTAPSNVDKYLTLSNESVDDLRYMRNEIYARHGKVFASKDLQEYFLKTDWYKPSPTFDANALTEGEKKLIDVIKNLEKNLKK